MLSGMSILIDSAKRKRKPLNRPLNRGLKPRRSLGSLNYSTLKLMRSTCIKSSDTAVLKNAAA